MESKEVSWQWVTADALLSEKECELLLAHLVVSADGGSVTLYDGENTTGKQIITLVGSAAAHPVFSGLVPVYCQKGLYIDVGSNVTGVLVMWRNL